MNVLICHNAYQIYGGEDHVVAAEIALLEQNGHQVTLWRVTNDDIKGPLGKINAGLRAAYSQKAKQTLKALIEAHTPEIVHVHNFFPLMSPSVFDACQEMGVPVIQTLHNFRFFCAKGTLNRDGKFCEKCLHHSPYQAVKHGCYRGSKLQTIPVAHMIDKHRRARTFIEKVDRFIALTEFSKSKFLEYGIPSKKIAIKPNFLHCQNKGLPLSMRDIPVVYVGRLSEEKGIDTLIKMADKLAYPITVIGEGPLQSAVMSNNNIRYLGALAHDEVMDSVGRSRVLVLPSVCPESGLALSVKEAMMQGTSVVVSDIGSLGEKVAHKVNGLKAPVNDVDAFVEQVSLLMEDDHLWQAISTKAVQFAQDNYTPASNIDQLLNIYQDVIAQYPANQGECHAKT
ncbi:MAG: glycosyltransferase family 4 protein [Cellvibrionales bacterium]|nr:glycosyltransferase family 4 protein [Cellvibrionales bacterium]